MKINSKIRYGLRAMVEIASAQSDEGILQKDIAIAQSISNKYLDAIILALKKKGLIKNFRGKGSGYVLTKSAADITLLDIYTAFDKIAFVDCEKGLKVCPLACHCVAKVCWTELQAEFEQSLANRRLIDML